MARGDKIKLLTKPISETNKITVISADFCQFQHPRIRLYLTNEENYDCFEKSQLSRWCFWQIMSQIYNAIVVDVYDSNQHSTRGYECTMILHDIEYNWYEKAIPQSSCPCPSPSCYLRIDRGKDANTDSSRKKDGRNGHVLCLSLAGAGVVMGSCE